MDFKVIFQDSFVEDLERIVRLIASQNPAAAVGFGELVCLFRFTKRRSGSLEPLGQFSAEVTCSMQNAPDLHPALDFAVKNEVSPESCHTPRADIRKSKI